MARFFRPMSQEDSCFNIDDFVEELTPKTKFN